MPTEATRGRCSERDETHSGARQRRDRQTIGSGQRLRRLCPSAGSSSAPSPGSAAAADWRRIGNASIARLSSSCASPPSASCCESYAIPRDVLGQTLSILFLGPEIVRSWRGQTSFTIRHPWVVAFAFGLLHGFGFASALTSAGLPHSDLPLALLSFNVGVEIGQLSLVALVLLLERSFRILEIRWPRWAEICQATPWARSAPSGRSSASQFSSQSAIEEHAGRHKPCTIDAVCAVPKSADLTFSPRPRE